MLNQARRKAADIAWVQADAAALPFASGSFDFVCCQFAFHHIQDRAGTLRAVFQALRPGGRFVLRNMYPQQSADWLCYEYFPEVQTIDLLDFWAADIVIENMNEAGFAEAEATYEHVNFEQDLSTWLEIVRRRDTCSQLQAISDAAYQEGVKRLERDIADPKIPRSRMNHLCLVTIRGEAPRVGR